MSTTTTTRLAEGTRVMYIGGDAEHNEALVGQQGVIRTDDLTETLPYHVDFENRGLWWCSGTALRTIPAVGDTVIAVVVPAIARLSGHQARVTDVTHVRGDRIQIRGEFQSHQKPDDTESFVFEEWTPLAPNLAEWVPTVGDRVNVTGYLSDDGIVDVAAQPGLVTRVDDGVWSVHVAAIGHIVSGPGYVMPLDGHTMTVSSDDGRVATLERELARANERVEEYGARAAKWERDFNRYAERVMQEAIDRDWCSEYERVVDSIRYDLEIAEIPDRDEEVDIEWEETYTVTVRRSATVTLKHGYDSDDVDEAARSRNSDDDAASSEIIDAVRNGNYSSEEYVDGSAATC
jgi:hypothetical protein